MDVNLIVPSDINTVTHKKNSSKFYNMFDFPKNNNVNKTNTVFVCVYNNILFVIKQTKVNQCTQSTQSTQSTNNNLNDVCHTFRYDGYITISKYSFKDNGIRLMNIYNIRINDNILYIPQDNDTVNGMFKILYHKGLIILFQPKPTSICQEFYENNGLSIIINLDNGQYMCFSNYANDGYHGNKFLILKRTNIKTITSMVVIDVNNKKYTIFFDSNYDLSDIAYDSQIKDITYQGEVFDDDEVEYTEIKNLLFDDEFIYDFYPNKMKFVALNKKTNYEFTYIDSNGESLSDAENLRFIIKEGIMGFNDKIEFTKKMTNDILTLTFKLKMDNSDDYELQFKLNRVIVLGFNLDDQN